MNWASIDAREGFLIFWNLTPFLLIQKSVLIYSSCNDFDKKWVINTRRVTCNMVVTAKQPWLVLWNRQSMVIGKNLDCEVSVDIRGLYVLESPELKKGEGFQNLCLSVCLSVCLFVSSAREITAQSISTILAKNASTTPIIDALKLQHRIIREVGEAAGRAGVGYSCVLFNYHSCKTKWVRKFVPVVPGTVYFLRKPSKITEYK